MNKFRFMKTWKPCPDVSLQSGLGNKVSRSCYPAPASQRKEQEARENEQTSCLPAKRHCSQTHRPMLSPLHFKVHLTVSPCSQPHTSSLSHTDVHPDCLGSFPTLGICPYSCQPEYLRQSCGQDSPLTLVQGYCLSIRLFFIVLFPFFLCSVNLIFIFFIVRNQTRCLVRVG